LLPWKKVCESFPLAATSVGHSRCVMDLTTTTSTKAAGKPMMAFCQLHWEQAHILLVLEKISRKLRPGGLAGELPP
jgi:hypothetical protein